MSSPISTRTATVAGTAALAGNLIAYAIGKSAGATYDAGQPYPIGPAMVGITTVIAITVGTLVFNRLASRKPQATRWLSTGGLVFALVSAPNGYVASHDGPTGVALATMHLITGLAWILMSRPAVKA